LEAGGFAVWASLEPVDEGTQTSSRVAKISNHSTHPR